MTEEIFGPLLPIVEFNDFDQVKNYLKNAEKPLCIFYFGNNKSLNFTYLKNNSFSGTLMSNDIVVNYAYFTSGFGGVG